MAENNHILPPNLEILLPIDWEDYELQDSGDGRKLERFGGYILDRPEPEALWKPTLNTASWEKAHAAYQSGNGKSSGHWLKNKGIPDRWQMNYKELTFWIQLSKSRHVGVFPEQAPQWDWVQKKVSLSSTPIQVLNLFGYTGIISAAACAVGAKVTHLDASRRAINWAKQNQQLSNLPSDSIRWIVDDALKFLKREVKRGSRYDGIIIDPPKFGRGPKSEVWEFYKLIPEILDHCYQVFSTKPKFFLMTAYAVKASPLTLSYIIKDIMKEFNGKVTAGENVLIEKSAQRLLPTAIFVRWESS